MKQEDFQKLVASWADLNTFIEYVWVEDPAAFGPVRFKRWKASVDLLGKLVRHKHLVILKNRQMGISWALAVFACWQLVSKPMSKTLVISVGEKEAQLFLSHVKFIFANLLRETPFDADILGWKLSPDSSEAIGIVWDAQKKIQSTVIALPCTGTSGTSHTATAIICDEYDKWRTSAGSISIQEDSYSALMPAITRTRGWFIACSTSEKLEPESYFKYLYRQAKSGENDFIPVFYDVTWHPDYSEDWFEGICLQYKGKEYIREENYPRTEKEALEPPDVERIFPKSDLLREEARLRPFRQEGNVYTLYSHVSGVKYVAGADVASGHGSDYSVLSIIGTKGLSSEVVAVIRSKHLTTSEFAREIYRVCETYNFPLLAIERNAMGVSVVDELIEMKYPRLYYKDDNARKNGKPGVTTGQSARQRGPNETGENWIWALATAIDSGALKTYFPPQIEELSDFYWIDGKAQARKGLNDDCVPAGTLITTSDGAKPIEQVAVGDMVLTHQGRFRRVAATGSRYADVVYEVSAVGRPNLCLTSNHHLYLRKCERNYRDRTNRLYHKIPTWVCVDDGEDLTQYATTTAILNEAVDIASLDLLEYAPSTYTDEDGWLAAYISRSHKTFVNPKQNRIRRHIPIDADFCRLLGYHAAEGSAGVHSVHWASHTREQPIRDWQTGYLRGLGLHPWEKRTSDNGWSVSIGSVPLSRFFKTFKTNTEKRLPEWALRLPPEKQWYILEGWLLGDGCFSDGKASAVSISPHLAMQMYQIALRLGYPCALAKCNGQHGHHSQYHIGFSRPVAQQIRTRMDSRLLAGKLVGDGAYHCDQTSLRIENGMLSGKIQSVREVPHNGMVYNLEVEDDHSYVANGTTVHNCAMSLAIANLLLRKSVGGTPFYLDLGNHPIHRTLVAT